MLPASNRGAGMNIGAPDVCLTPPGVPIPYPNFAANSLASGFSGTTKICMLPAIHLGTTIPVTFGDDPGTLHPQHKDKGAYVQGSPLVFVDKMPAINLTNPTTGNAGNDGVGAHVVPCAVNVFYTDRCGGRPVRELASELFAQPLGEWLWIRVGAFAPGLSAQLFHALRQHPDRAARGLLVDLRGNGGGELDACLDWIDDFVHRGTLLLEQRDERGDAIRHYARKVSAYRMPVVVIVDGTSASAAELFAASLQQLGRAVVVGEKSFGKPTAQAWVSCSDGPRYASVARFRLADGTSLPEGGVVPDVTLCDAHRFPPCEAAAWIPDPALALACRVLQQIDACGWR